MPSSLLICHPGRRALTRLSELLSRSRLCAGSGDKHRDDTLASPRYPIRPRQRHLRHGGGLHRQRHQVLRLRDCARGSCRWPAAMVCALQRQHGEIVGEPPAGQHRIEALR